MSPYRRSPRPLSLALDRIRDELAPQTLLADAQRAWPEAVGATIAREATPVSERGGVLTVSCSASVWAQELDLMGPVLLERLNERLRGQKLSRLRCVALPPRPPARE
jgi:predicted nucleic acid-binding Zn ribbon protein